MLEFKEVLQFAGPCWLANMSLNSIYIFKTQFPNLAKYDYPIDGGKNLLDGHRALGNSTTWPGLAVATIAGGLLSVIFSFNLGLGMIFGLSVYFGHALGSFIKRRAGYPDGKYMPFVDHGDYIVTTGIILGLLHQFTWLAILIGVIITYIVHPIVTYIAYLLKLHKYPQ